MFHFNLHDCVNVRNENPDALHVLRPWSTLWKRDN